MDTELDIIGIDPNLYFAGYAGYYGEDQDETVTLQQETVQEVRSLLFVSIKHTVPVPFILNRVMFDLMLDFESIKQAFGNVFGSKHGLMKL
jgi:hypothetical protein